MIKTVEESYKGILTDKRQLGPYPMERLKRVDIPGYQLYFGGEFRKADSMTNHMESNESISCFLNSESQSCGRHHPAGIGQ